MNDFSSRLALRRIHTHVEWRVMAEAEATLPIVDLRRRHPYIKQNPIQRIDADVLSRLADFAKSPMNQLEACILDRRSGRNRLRITIERKKTPLVTQNGKNPAAVTATTKRRVHIDTVGLDRQGLYRLFKQHRHMGGTERHNTRSPRPGGKSPSSASAARSFCCFQPASLQISKCDPMPTRKTVFSNCA